MIEGMAMVLGEAVDRILPEPRNFPTCNVFDWTSEEYEYYQRAPITTVTIPPPTGSTTPPSQPLHGIDISNINVITNLVKHNLNIHMMSAFCKKKMVGWVGILGTAYPNYKLTIFLNLTPR